MITAEKTGTAHSDSITQKKAKRKKRRRIILFSIVILLVVFRLVLPYIVLHYVNDKLAHLEEYYGHVDDIDIALLRGAYVINDINLVKIEERESKSDSIPFFKSPEIDLSVEWRAIFKGRIVGEIAVDKPELNFVKGKHKNEDVKADTADFRSLIKDLMPLTVNRFEITNGKIRYIDKVSKPKVDIAMTDIMVIATNLSNVNDSTKLLPAQCDVSANVYEGKFTMKVSFDALQKQPTFDMNTNLTGVNLVLLNDFLKAYGNFDVKKGNFGMYAEFAAKEGGFGGYVKPILKDMDIVQWNKEEGDFKQILWETVIGSAAEVLQNQKEEQLATKVPIEGKFDNADVNLWRSISFVLKNAFVQALQPYVDNSININKMEEEGKKTFLEKIFGNKKKKKAEEKEKK
jgi:predicted nucleic acid-binding Zn ribbon protein